MANGHWFLCLVLFHGALAQENCEYFTVSANCSLTTVEAGCLKLQDALQQIATSSAECVVINLDPGEHVLRSAIAIEGINISLRVYGGEEASITCVSPHDTSEDVNHTVKFDGLESLVLHGVNVHNCSRPIRIGNIRLVSILQSEFRYDHNIIIGEFWIEFQTANIMWPTGDLYIANIFGETQ